MEMEVIRKLIWICSHSTNVLFGDPPKLSHKKTLNFLLFFFSFKTLFMHIISRARLEWKTLKMTHKTFVRSAERIWALPVGRRKIVWSVLALFWGWGCLLNMDANSPGSRLFKYQSWNNPPPRAAFRTICIAAKLKLQSHVMHWGRKRSYTVKEATVKLWMNVPDRQNPIQNDWFNIITRSSNIWEY